MTGSGRFVLWSVLLAGIVSAGEIVEHPYRGVTSITRYETAPRNLTMHIVAIDLTTPGLSFKLTPPGGTLETVRQTTLDFLKQEHAQIAINGHYFVPFPSKSPDASLVGFAASNGATYSAFETPEQSYAIVKDAPALNIDRENHAAILHRDERYPDGKHVREPARIWTAISGSAQIVTEGVKSIPEYGTVLTPGGPGKYSGTHSWYDATNARTAIGLTRDNRTLILFTVDRAAGSQGMKIGEVADLLIADYGVYNALNLDGGGSTTLAMEDPVTHKDSIVNVSSDNPKGRLSGSNLAVLIERRSP